jgi:hypothetical protein
MENWCISKAGNYLEGMSLGRELFGFLLRSDLNGAEIAEWAGITMDIA